MKKSIRSVRSTPGISLPDMGPFAGLVFLVVAFYMLAGRFKQDGDGLETGIVALDQLPAAPSTCFKPLAPNGFGGCVISLNTEKNFSFALPGTYQNFQAKVIEYVASQHRIKLSPSQLVELQSLPFLACNVEMLPSILDAPRWERQKLMVSKTFRKLSKNQLAECIAATKALAPSLSRYQVFFYLRVHEDVKSTQFYCLTDLLQSQGINRFNLLTRAR